MDLRSNKVSGQRGGATQVILVIVGIVAFLGLLFVGSAFVGWEQPGPEQLAALQEKIEQAESDSDAGKDAVLEEYGGLIDEINATVNGNTTLLQTAAELEKMQYPDEVIFLGIWHEDPDGFGTEKALDIVKRLEWDGYSFSVVNGYGTGTLDVNDQDVEVIIIDGEIENRDYATHWRLYLPATAISTGVAVQQ